MKGRTRVLIADDHPVVREGLKRIIADSPDMEVIAEAGDGVEALRLAKDPAVDVLLLDITMPGPGFLEVLHRAKAHRPELAVLILSVLPEQQYAVRALRAGASGYLTKDNSATELAKAVRRVASGKKYVSEALAEHLAEEMGAPTIQAPHERLSDREYQTFYHLAAGKTVSEVAELLSISPKTVSTYRARILDKMGLANNAEIMRYAVDWGLTGPAFGDAT
jgi:DNA-binding NarL/FixJ family response regulator